MPEDLERCSYETVRRIALGLPGVQDGLSYRAPALFANAKLFIRLRDDLDAVVVKTTFSEREAWLAAEPDVCFITDHYRKYEWLLVRLDPVGAALLLRLITRAHELATAAKRPGKLPRRLSPSG